MGTNLHAYGKTFLAEWPEETTDLFITYYSGRYIPVKEVDITKTAASPPPSISGALSSFREAADITKYVQYLPYMADKPKSSVTSPPLSATGVPTATRSGSVPPTRSSASGDAPAPTPQYQPPRPRAAFSIFVDYPTCFVRFLEAMIADEGFAARDNKDVDDICTTLFEAYLREARNGMKESKPMWEEKAKSLLTDRKVPLPTQAFVDVLTTSYLSIQLFYFLTSLRSTKEHVSFANVHLSKSTLSAPTQANAIPKTPSRPCTNTDPTNPTCIS